MSNPEIEVDPIGFHMENLAFKIQVGMKDSTVLATITEDKIEVLEAEIAQAKDLIKWRAKVNDKPF